MYSKYIAASGKIEMAGSPTMAQPSTNRTEESLHVARQLDRMHEELGQLEEAVARLYNFLQPIMRPMPPQEQGKEAQEVSMSPVAETLFRLNAAMARVRGIIEHTTEALEV